MKRKQVLVCDPVNAASQEAERLAATVRELEPSDLDAAVRWTEALVRVTMTRDQGRLAAFWDDLRAVVIAERDRRSTAAPREVQDLERLFKL